MDERYVEITIAPDGKSSSLETRGFSGGACRLASEPYEKMMGKVLSDRTTAEGCVEPDALSQKGKVELEL